MKKQLAVDSRRGFSVIAPPFGGRIGLKHDDSDNRNYPTVTRPVSQAAAVTSGWGQTRFDDAGLPASLQDWLASRDALIIR